MTTTDDISPTDATPVEIPVPTQDLSGIIGHRFIYTYANGWQYEMYVRNATTVDYRIHSGHVAGRWVKKQTVDLVLLDEGIYKLAWTEPTGSSVVVTVIPDKRRVHGTTFYPQWIKQDVSKTVLYQNDHFAQMAEHRDAGPTYPLHVISEFATITLFEEVGADRDSIIAVDPNYLPEGYTERTN